jgi:hypothetical protein
MLGKIKSKFLGISELNPIADWHSNNVLKGIEKNGVTFVSDLPITQLGDKIVSIWKAPTFWVRIKFLLTGKVNFQILAQTHAPIAISIGEYGKEE